MTIRQGLADDLLWKSASQPVVVVESGVVIARGRQINQPVERALDGSERTSTQIVGSLLHVHSLQNSGHRTPRAESNSRLHHHRVFRMAYLSGTPLISR